MDNITKIKDSKGRDVVEYYYDIANRLTKKMYSTGAQVKYEYDAAGNIMKVIDPKDAETAYEYYGNNWLKKVTFPDGNNVFYECSESGDLTKVTLPDGGEIQYEYFLDHSLNKVTLPDESTRSVEYDLYGNIYRLTDGRGKNVRFKYDTLQQIDETKRKLSGVDKITGYEYNKNGDLIKVTDARGNSTEFHYDKAGNISKIEYPDNTSEKFQYDGSGNLAEHKDGKGKTTHFVYDSDDRLEEVRVPNGDSVNYYYDKNGNIKKRGDHFADESRSDTITEYEYDSNDRLSGVKCVDSSGKVLYRHKFAYDITNLTTEFSDIFGQDYGGGLKYGESNVIGKTQGKKYDHIYKFSEDESGVKPLKYGGGDLGFKYGELPLGEPGDIPARDGNGGDQNGGGQNGGNQGDGEGSKTNIPGRIKYGMGEKKSEFTYDNLSRLTEYTDFFGNKFYYGYDRYSRLALVKYPNNILTGYTYDEAGRLDSITHKRGSGDVLRSCGYQYDANGNITRITNEDFSYIDYEYDDWNRLTRETWKNAVGFTTLDIQYSYDNPVGDTGNIHQKIVSRNGGSPETTTFNYDAYNKLTSITHPDSSTETLNYDSNGQLTSRVKPNGETTQYKWSDQGFLTKVTLPSGEPVEYKYDGIDRLIGRSDAENDSVFIQSGFNIMMDLDENKKRTYYTGTSEIEDGGNPKYFHYNHRGDTVIITDNEGNILHELNYEAYGEPTDSSGRPINPWGGSSGGSANSLGTPVYNPLTKDFPGLFVGGSGIRYDCKTNLQYMRYRWFSQDQMRFINPDLLMNTNRYAYVEGNPISSIDPLGLWTLKIRNGRIIAVSESPSNLTAQGRTNLKNMLGLSSNFDLAGKEVGYPNKDNNRAFDVTSEFNANIRRTLKFQKGGRNNMSLNCAAFALNVSDTIKTHSLSSPNIREGDKVYSPEHPQYEQKKHKLEKKMEKQFKANIGKTFNFSPKAQNMGTARIYTYDQIVNGSFLRPGDIIIVTYLRDTFEMRGTVYRIETHFGKYFHYLIYTGVRNNKNQPIFLAKCGYRSLIDFEYLMPLSPNEAITIIRPKRSPIGGMSKCRK